MCFLFFLILRRHPISNRTDSFSAYATLFRSAHDRSMVRIEADPAKPTLRRRAPPARHGSPRIPMPASVTLDQRGEQRQPDVADEHDEPFTHGRAAPHPDAVVGVASRLKANAARSQIGRAHV